MWIYISDFDSLSECFNFSLYLSPPGWEGLWQSAIIFVLSFNSAIRSSQRLCGFDSAGHLHFQNSCNFRTLDHFHRSWQAVAINQWESISSSILLQGNRNGLRTVLQDMKDYCDSIITVYMYCIIEIATFTRSLQNVKKGGETSAVIVA